MTKQMKNSIFWNYYLMVITAEALGIVIKNLTRSVKSASDAFRKFNEAIERIKKED